MSLHNAQLSQDPLDWTLQTCEGACNDSDDLFQSGKHGWLDRGLHNVTLAKVCESGHLDTSDRSGEQAKRREDADQKSLGRAAMKSQDETYRHQRKGKVHDYVNR